MKLKFVLVMVLLLLVSEVCAVSSIEGIYKNEFVEKIIDNSINGSYKNSSVGISFPDLFDDKDGEKQKHYLDDLIEVVGMISFFYISMLILFFMNRKKGFNSYQI
ncbi:MAG: hypothetical protein JXA91_02580 [Candidatus Thermoplasmatota archaeon]|nr:hypothetical protein [Candidatus Thermoplasmatota archaeon]